MSNKYKFHNPEGIYFVTLTVVEWIDVFTRRVYKDIFYESVKHCQENKDLDVYAYCIMTNHIHMIISSRGNPLSNIMRDLKRHTSEKIKLEILFSPKESRRSWMIEIMKREGVSNSNNDKFQFWIQDSHPIELVSTQILQQKLAYIHNNPVTAGFVLEPVFWKDSSAAFYEKKEVNPLIKLKNIFG